MREELLKRVLRRYRGSPDFNGLYLDGDTTDDEKAAAASLVRDGLAQVVTEKDYPNPHIRPWPSRRSVEDQIESIEELDPEKYGLCLYPTPNALKKHRTQRTDQGQPYRQAMAKGRGTLELAYFRFDVLEQYRNDPRFHFDFDDFGTRTVISDEAYQDVDEPEYDKIVMDHIGFAYDLSEYDSTDESSPLVRRACAFYCHLAKLSPEHQQRWKTYEVEGNEALSAHPIWWSQQMGHWPDGLGPFQAFFFELEALNTLNEQAFGQKLFRITERPREFGWVLRPSQSEWDLFVHQLDKLLSDNLSHAALDRLGAPQRDDRNQQLGTINRLALALQRRGNTESAVREALEPFREVRRARQRPAHALRANVTDKTYVHKQVALLERVNDSLNQLRRFWQTHRANRDWTEPDYVSEAHYYRT